MDGATAFTKSDAEITPQEALEQLVGEGKKYATVEEAAKGLWHAQRHITGLETSYSELKTDLDKRLTAEELLKQVLEKKDQTPVQTSAKGESPIDVDALLKKAEERAINAVTTRELENSAKQNELRITDALVSELGSIENAAAAIRTAASNFGVSLEEFTEMARTKPRIVEGLLGLGKKTAAKTHSPVVGNTSTARAKQQMDAGVGTPAYWEGMRASNPKQYYSKDMSKKRLQDLISHRSAS